MFDVVGAQYEFYFKVKITTYTLGFSLISLRIIKGHKAFLFPKQKKNPKSSHQNVLLKGVKISD